jgi:choice-of-anchor C domain-containing protein
MFSMRIHAATVAAAILLAGAGVATAAGTVSRFDDGSFEYPTAPANAFQTFSAGQTMGPWRVTSGSVDLIGAGFWQAAEGDQSVDLNGQGPGAVTQTFTTVPGATYTVTYSLAGNPGATPVVKTGQVLIDGQDFQDFSFDTTGKTNTNLGYVTRQFTFVANNPSTTVTFISTTSDSARGPVLDNVQIQRCSPCPSCGG